MSEATATPARRPTVVALLYAYCAVVILLALIALGAGAVMMAFADDFDAYDSESFLIGGGVVAFLGGALGVIHAVPLFLRRSDSSWRVIFGFLIAYIILWGMTFYLLPLLAIPALLLSRWIQPYVTDYYGVITARPREYYGQRRRGADWDDGWDTAWDRPRQ